MDIQKLSEETKLKIENLKSQIDILEDELRLFPITLLKVGVFFLSVVLATAISNEFEGLDPPARKATGLGLAVTIYSSCLKNIRVFKKHSKLKALQREIHKVNIKKWRDKRNKTLQK